MILMNMTTKEVYNHMRIDIYETLHLRIDQAFRRWQRFLRKHTVSSRQRIVQCLSVSAGHQPYLIYFTWDPEHDRKDAMAIYAVVRTEGRIYYVFFPPSPLQKQIDCWTDHFLYRYSERCHLGLNNPTDILGKYVKDNQQEMCVYGDEVENPRDLVYMTPDGIELARVMNGCWCVRRTFVTIDMLTNDQREAFRTVMPAYEEMLTIWDKYNRDDDFGSFLSSFNDFTKKYNEDFKQVETIYAQYYE